MALGVIVGSVVTVLFPLGDHAMPGRRSLPPYMVKVDGPNSASSLIGIQAECDLGDRATGGGFEGVDATTRIIDSTPRDTDNDNVPDAWRVQYRTGADFDVVSAVAVCQDRKPRHS